MIARGPPEIRVICSFLNGDCDMQLISKVELIGWPSSNFGLHKCTKSGSYMQLMFHSTSSKTFLFLKARQLKKGFHHSYITHQWTGPGCLKQNTARTTQRYEPLLPLTSKLRVCRRREDRCLFFLEK